MIRQSEYNISEDSQKLLDSLQKKINAEKLFKDKVAKAQTLWNSKKSSAEKKAAFDEIIRALEDLSVSVEVCNYCEHNEGNDIEHIFPKSFFPERTFKWDNYLLACKQCNTAFKLDVFAILDENDDPVILTRGEEPLNDRGAFINPRVEDPNRFMLLNMSTFKFMTLPDLTTADDWKSKKTLEILDLNERHTLIKGREQSAKYFFERIHKLVSILNAKSVDEINEIISPYDQYFDENMGLYDMKELIKENFKNDILVHQHPSVWHSILTISSKTDPKWIKLFKSLPEALDWKHTFDLS